MTSATFSDLRTPSPLSPGWGLVWFNSGGPNIFCFVWFGPDGLIELRCGQWAQKMVYFWDLISATFLIIQKFTIPQNVNDKSCSGIAEVYLVQFWEL